jgi:predicted O-methyltransferase YrrM
MIAKRSEAAKYPETWVSLEQIKGKEFNEFVLPYKPTLAQGDFVDARHQELASAPTGMLGIPVCIDIGVEGFLTHGDALKIYELAATVDGDVLELGTHKGLSTSIIAEALVAKGNGILEAVDIDLVTNIQARETISKRIGADRVNFVVMDATKRLDELVAMGRKFGFVFVDHWHGYEATYEAAVRLHELMNPGGFALFHDAINPGNADPEHPYGVFPAIQDTIGQDPRFEFYGNFGCCSLYRFSGTPRSFAYRVKRRIVSRLTA